MYIIDCVLINIVCLLEQSLTSPYSLFGGGCTDTVISSMILEKVQQRMSRLKEEGCCYSLNDMISTYEQNNNIVRSPTLYAIVGCVYVIRCVFSL